MTLTAIVNSSAAVAASLNKCRNMEALGPVAARAFECAALVVIGYSLRRSGLFSSSDGQTAQNLAKYITLPAVILQACTAVPSAGWSLLVGGALVLAVTAGVAAFTWVYHRQRLKRDRALLAGSSVGWSVPLVALPFVEALYGSAGVVAACSVLVANALAVHGASFLLFASAGPAFPEQYEHQDGGTYKGEWKGYKKEGLGVYKYPSGARYEGEWRANVKDGRGVYYFPKGGTYEGEWSGGVMSGVGVRTYSTGRVEAGRWSNGKLVGKLELWQCAIAAEGAGAAALAARRVRVVGGKPADVVQQLLLEPVLWAALAGMAANALQLHLSESVAAVVQALAPANRPLMLLSAGLLLNIEPPEPRQVGEINAVLASRYCIALFVSANALVLLGSSCSPATLPLLVAALTTLSPIPLENATFARDFRLNEGLAAALRNASSVVGLGLMMLLALAGVALGVVPAQLPAAGQDVVTGAPTPIATAMLLAAAAAAVAASFVHQRYGTPQKVRMVYRGRTAAGTASQGQLQPQQAPSTTGSSGIGASTSETGQQIAPGEGPTGAQPGGDQPGPSGGPGVAAAAQQARSRAAWHGRSAGQQLHRQQQLRGVPSSNRLQFRRWQRCALGRRVQRGAGMAVSRQGQMQLGMLH